MTEYSLANTFAESALATTSEQINAAVAQSWTIRLATATVGVAAMSLAPLAVQSAPVRVTGSPIVKTVGGPNVFWDVDGNGSNDFQLFNSQGAVFFGSFGLNGRGLVAPYLTDNVLALSKSFDVGPTLASNEWGPGNMNSRNMMSATGAIGYDWTDGFNQGDNFFGFRFLNGSDMLYGFAVVNFDSPNKTITIQNWTYNTTADEAVHVPGPLGVVGLAMGAGWTRKLKQRMKAARGED